MTRSITVLLLFAAALPVSAQRFGGSLAILEDDVFVGETGNMSFASEVYIYSRANRWAETGRLAVSEKADRFGRALAGHGNILLAGASQAEEGTGIVYVFAPGGDGAWTQQAVLRAPDASEGDLFGSSLAFDGTTLAVSALGKGEHAGAVYVFDAGSDGAFTHMTTLTQEGVSSFGSVMALRDGTLLIGVPQHEDSRGIVFAYQREGQEVMLTGTLEPPGNAKNGRFGSALALGGDLAFVGMPNVVQSQGSVMVYERDESGKYAALPELRAFEPQAGASFGSSLAFEDDALWVGASGENRRNGSVYRFDRREDRWGSAARQVSSLAEGSAGFGTTLVVQGDVAVVGATGVDRREGAAVILTLDDGWQEQTIVINDIKSFPPVTGGQVQCTDGEALDWPCSDIDLVAFIPTHQMGGGRGTMANDVWGWTDPVSGREYALVGRDNGTSFVDVTMPEMPIYVGDLPMTEGSRANVWRDIKVYEDHAFVVADGAGEHGMQVFDLARLRDVEEMPVTFTATAHYDGIHSAHNIVINEDTGFAYAVGASGGGETCGGGLHMINIQDPVAPVFAGCFADPSTGRRGTGYSHDAQCVIYHGPDDRYVGNEICIGSNETALSISDVTDKGNTKALSMSAYPKVAYAHQGWLSVDHTYFYMNDEGDEPQDLVEGTRTLVWDVTDLEDPVLIHEYIAPTTTTDHNLYIKDNLMYQANYGSGLRILDITTPDNPVEVGFFDTTPTNAGGGAWSNYPYFKSGVIIVTSMGEGLFVLKQRTAGT